MIRAPQGLHVKGHSEFEAVGEFAGRVIAIAFRGGDPIGDPVSEVAAVGEGQESVAPEGLGGWGSTYLLVIDPHHPAPFWVPKSDVEATTLE